jgi:hypothetical protein
MKNDEALSPNTTAVLAKMPSRYSPLDSSIPKIRGIDQQADDTLHVSIVLSALEWRFLAPKLQCYLYIKN